MSRLTIAIPTFRRPQDLKRAVRGVLEQAGELVGGPRVEAREPEGDAAGAADVDGGAGRGVSDVEVLVIVDEDEQVAPTGLIQGAVAHRRHTGPLLDDVAQAHAPGLLRRLR